MAWVLASASPRRLQLLRSSGLEPSEVRPADIDESPHQHENPIEYAVRMADEKARAAHQAGWTLAADTVVHLGDAIFGKPANDDEACRMLQRLSGKSHKVTSAWSLIGDQQFTNKQTTTVAFRSLTAMEIRHYVSRNESLDKAGGYAIQGHGIHLVEHVDGCLATVIGLPLPQVLAAFSDAGLR